MIAATSALASLPALDHVEAKLDARPRQVDCNGGCSEQCRVWLVVARATVMTGSELEVLSSDADPALCAMSCCRARMPL
jgi:hypothetical protein